MGVYIYRSTGNLLFNPIKLDYSTAYLASYCLSRSKTNHLINNSINDVDFPNSETAHLKVRTPSGVTFNSKSNLFFNLPVP